MRPLIREGDLVNVIPTNYEQLRVGDIILARTARSNNHLLMHRLIRKFQRNGRPALVTQGDAAWYPDPPMAPDDILGKVLAVKRDKKLICLDRGWRRKLGWILGHLAFLIGWFNKNRVRKYVKFFLKFIPN
jgi:signal peptidase I